MGQPAPIPYYTQLFDEPAEPPVFDPNLENRGFSLGWFAKAEVAAVFPTIHSGLNSNFAVPGVFPSTVNTPIAQPGLSAMPRVELAYRFGQGMGELVTSFRTLSAQGTGTDSTFDPAGAGRITSRLNLNTLDIDYAATEFIPVRFPKIIPLFLIPGWLGMRSHPEYDSNPAPLTMRWMAGARLASVYFNSQGAGAVVLNDRIMNNFVGAGLHTSAEFTKAMPWKPLSIFAKFDASGILGDATQTFSETTLLGGTTTAAVRDITTGVPVFQFQGGMTWVPDWRNRRCRLSTGYQYEQWWYLGQTTGSTAGLTMQGMFFRGEWGY
jgi:hypothetical protein